VPPKLDSRSAAQLVSAFVFGRWLEFVPAVEPEIRSAVHCRGVQEGIMLSDEDGAARWRGMAAEARAVAAEMTDPEARQIMLSIAEAYDRLARYAEARKKK
jgi:hypothetical protein